MRLLWANPVALWALALLAVPVVIHWLLRPEIVRRRFPSLRFLPTSRLASARRRMIHDWPLLLVRMAILACAAAALAGPFLLTAAREEAWADRVVRALVVEVRSDGTEVVPRPLVERAVEEARAGAESTTRIDTARLADGLMEADAWLAAAPPGAREIVLLSDFREGSVSARDLAAIASEAGVRLVRLPAGGVSAADVRVLTFDGGTPVEQRRTLGLDGEPALSAPISGLPVTLPLRIEASAADHQLLDAAVEAVLAEGLFIGGAPVPVVLAWGGDGTRRVGDVQAPASPEVRQAIDRLIAAAGPSRLPRSEPDEAPWVPVWPGRLAAAQHNAGLVVLGRGPLGVDDALRVARASLRAMYPAPRLEQFEPRAIASDVLAGWERPAPPADLRAVAQAGTTDARWLWALVLVLMMVEQWMRRPRRAVETPKAVTGPEARVA